MTTRAPIRTTTRLPTRTTTVPPRLTRPPTRPTTTSTTILPTRWHQDNNDKFTNNFLADNHDQFSNNFLEEFGVYEDSDGEYEVHASVMTPADVENRVRSLEEIFQSLHVSSTGCKKMLVCHLTKDQEEFSPLSHLVLDLLDIDTAQVVKYWINQSNKSIEI